jgi:16S rRNA (guanine(1405)-N(7))-methyltransferase
MPGEVQTQEVDRILSTAKYRALPRETIEDVVGREIARHGPGARALKAARLVLHRVAARYLGRPDFRAFLRRLESCADSGARDAVCREILALHASTRERLPILEDLYRGLFGRTGLPRVVADLASACNPLAFRWMGLEKSVRYMAYDIDRDMVQLVGAYFRLEGIAGEAIHRDVLCSPPTLRADVALLLKMFHCLEHRRKGAGWEVVSAVPARVVAVSFPSRNLAGRSSDIAANYREGIRASAAQAGWGCEEMSFPGETVLLVTKEGS